MGNTRDSINELLEQIKNQGYNYILAIFEEDKSNKRADIIDLYSSYEAGHLKKLAKVIQTAEKQQSKEDKNNE